jgi:hypothetical protein
MYCIKHLPPASRVTSLAVSSEALEMTAFEDFVTERVLAGQSILGLYPPTEEANRRAFEAWRRERGR